MTTTTTTTAMMVDTARVDPHEQLANTGHTIEFVLQTLHKNNPEFGELLDGGKKVVKINSYDISEGKGYCSRVFKTSVWIGDTDRKPYTFVMKIPTTDAWNKMSVEEFSAAEKENNEATIKRMHNAEMDAYDLIRDLKGFPAPRIYYMERATPTSAGMIMMNDLGSGRGAALGIFYTVTQQQCFNLARHMADFQVYIDFMPDQPWRGRFNQNMHAKDDINTIWMKMLKPVMEYEDSDLVHKVKAVIMRMDPVKLGKYATEERAKEMGHTTLCHGDMWTNNMMIEVSEDGSVSDQILAIIDWQTFFEGSPIFDIARFMVNCADAEIRRACEYQVVDHYYDYLTAKYKEHGAAPRFTKEDAHELYELAFVQETVLFGVMFSLMGLPLKDSEDRAERAKLAKLALRFNLMLDDALPLMDKYKLVERCAKDTTNSSPHS